jgi:serine/threonine protein kinase
MAVDSVERRLKLQREITILQSIEHRYVIELFEVIETEGYIGLVMEYAPGGELFEYILAREYLSEKESSRIFAQIIDGIGYVTDSRMFYAFLEYCSSRLEIGKYFDG